MTGLSLSTISKHFNGLPVRAKNAQAIEEAARRIGFRVNAVAQSLRTRKSMTIGVMLPDIANSFHSTIVQKLADLIMPKGYSLIIGTYSNDLASLDTAVQFLLDKQVDGLVMVHGGDDGWPKCLDGREDSLAIVVLDRIDFHSTDAVVVDNDAAGRSAAQILLDHGHTRIGLIGGPNSISSLRGRTDGFIQGLRDAGVEIHPDNVVETELTVEAGLTAVSQLMNQDSPPTAIFATNGELTAGAIIGIHQMKLAIGEDISIVGFDDELLAKTVAPSLTILVQPTKDIARTAAELLLRRLDEPESLPIRAVLPCSVLTGNSVATIAPSPGDQLA